MVGALPGTTHEASGLAFRKRYAGRQIVLDPLEGSADVVAEPLEPLSRRLLAAVQFFRTHGSYLPAGGVRRLIGFGQSDVPDMMLSRPARKADNPRRSPSR
jgi:hypothetical protein